MRTTSFILCFSFLFSCCNKLFKDEELSQQRVPYTGNEIRTDGYYYYYWASQDSPVDDYTAVFFLYRNGVFLVGQSYKSINLDTVEKKMLDRYELLVQKKVGWGVFIITNDKLDFEHWYSAAGGLPVAKSLYYIENDTTLRSPYEQIYHFKQFSPKPDSSAAYKWIK